MIRYVKGDITKSNCDIICHQVNCQGAMNSGVAKVIREKWPIVYTSYITKCKRADGSAWLLGSIQPVDIGDHRYVVNMFTQENYGYDGERYTDYEAFASALDQIYDSTAAAGGEDKSIAFPYKIGCVRGGANWKIIRTMIEEVFKDREIYYYYLNEKDLDDEEQLLVIATEMLKQSTGVTLNE